MDTKSPREMPFTEPGFAEALVAQCFENDLEWGEAHDRAHTRADWLAILDQQFAKLRYEAHFNPRPEAFDERLIKIAAVCAGAWERTRA